MYISKYKFILTLKSIIITLKKANSLDEIGNIVHFLGALVLSGNVYLVGCISEALRNFHLTRWDRKHTLNIAIPIFEAQHYLNCATKTLKFQNIPTIFPKDYYRKEQRAFYDLAIIYGIFMKGDRKRARKYYSLLVSAIYNMKINSLNLIKYYLNSIFFPLSHPFSNLNLMNPQHLLIDFQLP